MLKRFVAISFVFIASFVLLAHMLVPHQHCEGHVCIVESLDKHECNHHNHEGEEHKHEHDGNPKDINCILNQVVILPSNHIKPECKHFCYVDDHADFDGFQAVLFDEIVKNYTPPEISNNQPLVVQTLHSSFIATKLGLRGPPMA